MCVPVLCVREGGGGMSLFCEIKGEREKQDRTGEKAKRKGEKSNGSSCCWHVPVFPQSWRAEDTPDWCFYMVLLSHGPVRGSGFSGLPLARWQ